MLDIYGKDRQVVINQPRADDPITVQVGHLEKGSNGEKQFVVDQQTAINMKDDGKPTIDVNKTQGLAKERDDREGYTANRRLYGPDEAARLAKLSDAVAANQPGAVENMRDELLRANEQYASGRQNVFAKYQELGKSPMLEADPKTGIMQLKDDMAPARSDNDLFVTAKDSLQSISPEAAARFSDSRSAFKELVTSMAALSPRDLLKMMEDNGDGTCTVTFPGASDKPITMAIPKKEERLADDEYRGTWPRVLASAYEQYLRQNVPGFASMSAEQMTESDTEPGAADRAFKLLLGKEPDHDHTALGGFSTRVRIGLDNHTLLGKRLDSAIEQGRPGIAYDRDTMQYRGILDYNPVSEVLYYNNDGALGSRNLQEVSPYIVGPGYFLSFNDVYLAPGKQQQLKAAKLDYR